MKPLYRRFENRSFKFIFFWLPLFAAALASYYPSHMLSLLILAIMIFYPEEGKIIVIASVAVGLIEKLLPAILDYQKALPALPDLFAQNDTLIAQTAWIWLIVYMVLNVYTRYKGRGTSFLFALESSDGLLYLLVIFTAGQHLIGGI
jgi:hypothetical protein